MFCLKGRRRIELPEIALLEWSVIVIYLFSVPISLCRRFSIVTTNLLNRSVFSIYVSDVDSNSSLRLEDSEEGESDEWCIVLQVSDLWLSIDYIKIILFRCIIHIFFKSQSLICFVSILCSCPSSYFLIFCDISWLRSRGQVVAPAAACEYSTLWSTHDRDCVLQKVWIGIFFLLLRLMWT